MTRKRLRKVNSRLGEVKDGFLTKVVSRAVSDRVSERHLDGSIGEKGKGGDMCP